MDILTIFKVIALAVFTVAAVFVMLAAATMWRTERAAASRITRLVSADPAEASGDKERADRALLDVTEITRRVSEEPAEADAEAEAEDVPAEIARLKEEVSFLNECREADSRRIQNLEERLDSLDDEYESCDDCDGDESCDAYPGNDDLCDDGAVPVAEVVKTLIVTADIPTLVARAWREDVEAFKQALKAAVNSTARDIEADTMESPAMKRHCEEQDEELHEMWLEMMDESIWKNIVRMEQEKGNPVAEKLHKPKRPSPSKYPLFEAKPSSKEWRQRGGLVIDRRMDELRGADNHSVWAARFQVNYVRKMDSIPLRVMAGVREAVDEAEKSAEKEN